MARGSMLDRLSGYFLDVNLHITLEGLALLVIAVVLIVAAVSDGVTL
jgi:hypothetical protein